MRAQLRQYLLALSTLICLLAAALAAGLLLLVAIRFDPLPEPPKLPPQTMRVRIPGPVPQLERPPAIHVSTADRPNPEWRRIVVSMQLP